MSLADKLNGTDNEPITVGYGSRFDIDLRDGRTIYAEKRRLEKMARKHMTRAQRKEVSERMKRYHAERRAAKAAQDRRAAADDAGTTRTSRTGETLRKLRTNTTPAPPMERAILTIGREHLIAVIEALMTANVGPFSVEAAPLKLGKV